MAETRTDTEETIPPTAHSLMCVHLCEAQESAFWGNPWPPWPQLPPSAELDKPWVMRFLPQVGVARPLPGLLTRPRGNEARPFPREPSGPCSPFPSAWQGNRNSCHFTALAAGDL